MSNAGTLSLPTASIPSTGGGPAPGPGSSAGLGNPHAISIDFILGGSRGLPKAKAASRPRDPAFDRYANLPALGRAWDALDASGVADGALALIEGERVLQRRHEGLKGADVAALAARLAVERGDGETLARLEKAAARSNDSTLAERLAAVKLLAGKTRTAAPAMTIDVETVTPVQYRDIVAVNRAAVRARVTGNAEYLLPLVDDAGDLRLPARLPATIQGPLGERVAALCEELSEEPSPSTVMLDILAAESRDVGINPSITYPPRDEEDVAEEPTDVTGGFG